MIDSLVKVTLPEMGESVTEGSIVEWRKRVGQWVDEGETLVDVTTDKVDVEVPSTTAGVITALHGSEGDTIAVGTVLAEIDATAAKPEGNAAAAPAASAALSTPKDADPTLVTPSGYGSSGSGAAPIGSAPANGHGSAGAASHKARLIAERYHLDLASIAGSGPDGLIVRADIDRAIATGTAKVAGNGAAAAPAVTFPAPSADAKISDLKGAAGTLAGYMDQSLTLPTATSFRTLHVGTLEARRAELNVALKSANRSEKVSFTHLIAYALVRAAAEQPAITASFRRENGKPQRVESGIHLGLAVDSQRKDGSRFLVVPVIKNAAALDFVAFRAKYEELVVKARDNKLTVDEQTGATFTLTNPGGIGTVASVPRLMVGQGAIIAAGAIALPPGFAHAADSVLKQLGIEKVMTMTSTYDHRVIQGAQSGEYLKRVEELLSGADRFFDEIFTAFGLSAAVRGTGYSGAPAPGTKPLTAAAAEAQPSEGNGFVSTEILKAVAAGMGMVSSYRRFGHLAANLDPLGSQPVGDPSLNPETWGLTPALMNAIPASVLRVKVPGNTLAEVLPRLRETYTSTIAYEIEHISNTAQRRWLREYIESGLHRSGLTPQRSVQVLQRLTKVETMERYFRKQFMSQKTFSIEGLDAMVPMLEELISMLAEDGTKTAVLGMAHRGRLSTIAHVVNRPYEELLAEFEAGAMKTADVDENDDATGDVKYHHGADGIYVTPIGTQIAVKLANNPSHLEAVDGVVEGITRALQTDHAQNPPALDFTTAAPILIHGDAAFAAQGVVAEVLNLQALAGYATGGTIHIISNNQVGFTTDPVEARSTRYSSDLAKGYDVPIVHVNADDVEACIAAVHLAIDYRRKFGRDTVIDLIGYRRFGHNEQDEPMYTQPQMYEAIKSHPTVRELFASRLVAQGILTAEQVKEIQDAATARITEAHKNVKSGESTKKLIGATKHANGIDEVPPSTGVERPALMRYAEALVTAPDGFTVNKKLASQFAKRQAALASDGEVDWGLAEGLAFASLISEGTPVRLSGQDSERGTFSHRHAVFHDANTNAKYVPLQHLEGAAASFEIHNSPLSEYAVLGFEYGYGAALTSSLVLWEAQFGDFNNGAQIIIDQFIAAGAAKWSERTRLTLLLPHGYEGAGPEHSSARLERFLQLSAEGNIRVANCSTSSQYFHLLRAQAKATHAYPLVVLTPKSLLRNRNAYGTLNDLVDGRFQELIDDARYTQNRESVERLLLVSGKIYHDLVASPLYGKATKTAIGRVELLSPLPKAAILKAIASYPNLKHIIWVQEEPKNMGARSHVRGRIAEEVAGRFADVEYVGRPYRASPSEGYPGAHVVEQDRIITAALTED
jgi:2-oxoglutarate dehydrogenase E1 component